MQGWLLLLLFEGVWVINHDLGYDCSLHTSSSLSWWVIFVFVFVLVSSVSKYFAAEQLKGENMDVPTSKTFLSKPLTALSPALPPAPIDPPEASPPLPTSSLLSLSSSSSSWAVSEVLQLDEPDPEFEPKIRHLSQTRTASCWVRDLQEGVGVTSSHQFNLIMPQGVTVSASQEVLRWELMRLI